MNSSNQSQCNTCVMDVSAREIVFTETGCNFCDQARVEWAKKQSISHSESVLLFDSLKQVGKYNVLIGLSGGADSSYLLHCAVVLGLRPLCFSIDNGYNDPKADENIMRLVETLKVPFFRYTIDLSKFKELQFAFIKAGLPNIEIPTDHILMAASYELAERYGIKTILSGGNVATESIMPASWGYNARDLVHIKDVYRQMTGKKLRGLPLCSLTKWNWYRWVKGIKTVYLLDLLDYHREKDIDKLVKLYGYKPCGEKHCESVFTWWFQNYYLFEKFGYDKRKPHLSSLIVSGQMTRDEALLEIEKSPIYPELGLERFAKSFPPRPHSEFKMDHYNLIAKIVKLCKS